MVRYQIDEITDEMVLGQSIFSSTGELLLAAGYRVTERYRRRLKELGFQSVLIEVEGTESVLPETIISEHVQKEVAVSFAKTAEELKDVLHFRKVTKESIQDLIRENKNHLEKIVANAGMTQVIDKLVDEILSIPAVVLNLSSLNQAGGGFLGHVLNVAITTLCIGRKFKLSYDEMKQLGMGVINYDIGLLAIPQEILEKDGELTKQEQTVFEQHTVYGHLMLSQNPAFPPTSAAVALQHHEYQDGSGYPRKLKGDNRPPLKDFSRASMIHRFAEIVSVADHYDMLTSGRRHFSKKFGIKESMAGLIRLSGSRLNSSVVKTLISIIPVYPVGARVRVLDSPIAQLIGYSGVIAKDNPDDLERPQIILYETRNHQRVKPVLINLAQHSGFVLELAG